MACISTPIPALDAENLTLFHTTDPQLSNAPVLIFYGPSTTGNSTRNSSRIEVHIFSVAGFQSYPCVTVSPNSHLYSAVNCLPQEKQGDEVCRGLAFSLLKYFSELPDAVKAALKMSSGLARPKGVGIAPTLFDALHASNIADRLVKVENQGDVVKSLESALTEHYISHVDVDVVLPPDTITSLPEEPAEEDDAGDDMQEDPSLKCYGEYAPLVKLFGPTVFVPTSKLRRAPSKPTTLNR